RQPVFLHVTNDELNGLNVLNGLNRSSGSSSSNLRVSTERQQENAMSGEKILLVEDNEVNRRLAEFLLRSQGYQVCEAANAQEAFDILKTERPDLIVMDIQLPGMDGLEATRKLKAQPATADIPVIAVTSYAMKGDRERALAAGCVGYVTKPIDKNIFMQEIAARIGDKAKIEN